MTIHFSFAAHAGKFDKHISASIPGYARLREMCVGLSPTFIQPDTTVLDIGCTTGSLLRSIRDANQPARPNIKYIGVDIVPEFGRHWRRNKASDVEFVVADARSYEGYDNLSLVLSLFTVQFLAPSDKLDVLKKVYDGLVPGGALIIAEKVYATNARFENTLTFLYHDHKRKTFSGDEILSKERSLRGCMTLWTEAELDQALRTVGFKEMQPIWMDFPFKAVLALKA